MKYLFYDLEYASSKGGISKICEFGYVLTDTPKGNKTRGVVKQNAIHFGCAQNLYAASLI